MWEWITQRAFFSFVTRCAAKMYRYFYVYSTFILIVRINTYILKSRGILFQ